MQRGLVRSDLTQLLAEQKYGFVKQRREFGEQMIPDVGSDGPAVVEAQQVVRQPADQKVGARPFVKS